jgi:tetratricopeptide (TPR) repeat protein
MVRILLLLILSLASLSAEPYIAPQQATTIASAPSQEELKKLEGRIGAVETRLADALDLQKVVYDRSINELNFWLTWVSIMLTILGLGSAALGFSSLNAVRKAKREANSITKEMKARIAKLDEVDNQTKKIQTDLQNLVTETVTRVEETVAKTDIQDVTKFGGEAFMQGVRFLRQYEQSPDDDLLFKISASWFHDGDVEKARSIMRQLHEKNPANSKYLYSMGRIEQEAKKFDIAIALYDRAFGVDPNHWNAKLNKAICLRDKGDPRAAMNELLSGEVLKKSGGHPLVYLNMASFALDLDQPDKALEFIDDAEAGYGMRNEQPPPIVQYNRACAYSMKGEKLKALDLLRGIIPAHPEFLNMALADGQIRRSISAPELRELAIQEEN